MSKTGVVPELFVIGEGPAEGIAVPRHAVLGVSADSSGRPPSLAEAVLSDRLERPGLDRSPTIPRYGRVRRILNRPNI